MKMFVQHTISLAMKDVRSRFIAGAAVLAVAVLPALYLLIPNDHANASDMQISATAEADDANIGVFGQESATTSSEGPGTSWPAEIVSSDIAQIQPQREGVIVEWRVGVGEHVSVGQVLGRISPPPATPELTQMLADQTESLAKAKAQAVVADEFAAKETARLRALGDSVGSADSAFTALKGLRDKADVQKKALRSFIERALAGHTSAVTNASDWRYVKPGSVAGYATNNQQVRIQYESKFLTLVGALKSSDDIPFDLASDYFDFATRFGNSLIDDTTGFRAMAAADQKEYLSMLADYREAQAMIADKETEYKLMIAEKSAELDKDRQMAHAEADAAEASYRTVSGQVTGSSYIYAPKSGSVSAIYKKTGDLVSPEMSIAVIAGKSGKAVVRMHIPSNTRKPKVGDIVSVVRPGFPTDAHQAKIVGVGSSLDSVGAYMADAALLDSIDWPIDSSVRVIPNGESLAKTIPVSAIWWDEGGKPYVWGVSEARRLFAKEVTLGRTLGTSIEVYSGLQPGDHYVVQPDPLMREDMVLQETAPDSSGSGAQSSGGHGSMPGMDM